MKGNVGGRGNLAIQIYESGSRLDNVIFSISVSVSATPAPAG